MLDPAELYPLKISLYSRSESGISLQELSDLEESLCTVQNGALAGRSLGEITRYYGRALLGRKWEDGRKFPLRLRFMEFSGRLGWHLFPAGAANFGIWYVLAADPEAKIRVGLNGRATRLQLLESLGTPEMEKLFHTYPAIPGDAYLLPPGVMYSAEGNLRLIQFEKNGQPEVDLGDLNDSPSRYSAELSSVDFNNRSAQRIVGTVGHTEFNRKYNIVEQYNFGKIWDLRLVSQWRDDTAIGGSFHLLIPLDEKVTLQPGNSSEALTVAPGEVVLVPANYGIYNLLPGAGSGSVVLKCTL